MILEIDAGNTSLKWRVINDNGDVISRGRKSYREDLSCVISEVEEFNLRIARVSCVAGAEIKNRIKLLLGDFKNLEVYFAKTIKSFSGLQIAYEDPLRLGVDRWLAMLAARSEGRACCVIDCGSAITVDLVDIKGRHLGGYIVPGLQTMSIGLLGEARQIKMDQGVSAASMKWGASTNEAVNNGIFRMSVSFVQSILDEIAGKDWQIVMTGGDAADIKEYMSTDLPVRCVPELVLDGLVVAFG